KIVQAWRGRAKTKVDNTDTSSPGDSIDCISLWGNQAQSSLSSFNWVANLFDMTPFFPPAAPQISVTFRIVTPPSLAGSTPPFTLNTGPGPYTDRIRIGRRVLSGPLLSEGTDSRTQAQDCFPTVQNASSPGQHFSPDGSNRFGSCAFSAGADIGINLC